MELSCGTKVITLEDPDFPYKSTLSAKQTVVETEKGSRYVYDFGAKRRLWELQWSYMEEVDYYALEDFIVNTANFSENVCAYTDHEGNVWNVRIMKFTAQRVNQNYYQVSLVLEEEV